MSAWANIGKLRTVNFTDIVSEERSRRLQATKETSFLEASKDGCCTSIESKGNLRCTGNISETSKLPHSDQNISGNNDSEGNLSKEEIEDSDDLSDEDKLTHSEDESSDEISNKYDVVLKGKKDDCKVSTLSSDSPIEDGKVLDFKSSYRYFKSLKLRFEKDEVEFFKLRTRCNELVMDPYTHILLYNMITSKFLKNVDYVINSGTGSIILHGFLDPSYPNATQDWPKHCAIKVFKKASRLKYNLSYVYKEGLVNEVESVLWWAQKAMDDLISVRKVGIPCPQVIKFKRRILVMSFIGKANKPAPKLKYACLCYSDFVKAYEQVKNTMKILYEKANLIHGDMTEYNILWYGGQCYFIDFTNSVNPGYEYAYYYLHSDCVNVTHYFGRRIPNIESAEELFMYITGFWYDDSILIKKMQKLYKENPNILHKPSEVPTLTSDVNVAGPYCSS